MVVYRRQNANIGRMELQHRVFGSMQRLVNHFKQHAFHRISSTSVLHVLQLSTLWQLLCVEGSCLHIHHCPAQMCRWYCKSPKHV